MQRQSYAQLAEDLHEAILWLARFGVQSQASRIGRLRKILLDLNAESENAAASALSSPKYADPASRIEAFTAIADASEITTAYESLRAVEDPELPAKLKRLAKGPLLADDEGAG